MNNRFRTILFDVAAVLVLLGAILYADLRLRSDVRRPQGVDHLSLHRSDPASLYSLRIRRQEKGSK